MTHTHTLRVSFRATEVSFQVRADGEDPEERFLREAYLTLEHADTPVLRCSFGGQVGLFPAPGADPDELADEFLRDCLVEDADAPERSDEELYG